ncbi:MAG TPA: type II toxin-antitoxin system HicA family toxin [Symbiobacteriaceae bacterium]
MPSWKDLKRLCEADGWQLYKDTDRYYQKIMPDGTIKRTKVSKGSGEIGYRLWRHIPKRQLQVTQEYFNSKI